MARSRVVGTNTSSLWGDPQTRIDGARGCAVYANLYVEIYAAIVSLLATTINPESLISNSMAIAVPDVCVVSRLDRTAACSPV